jgi:hypothetical protein
MCGFRRSCYHSCYQLRPNRTLASVQFRIVRSSLSVCRKNAMHCWFSLIQVVCRRPECGVPGRFFRHWLAILKNGYLSRQRPPGCTAALQELKNGIAYLRYFRKITGVPFATSPANFSASQFVILTHPCDSTCPIRPGSGVPCIP